MSLKSLNPQLASLPSLTIPAPKTPEEFHARLDQRREAALEIAATILTVAERVKDDLAAVADLVAEAQMYLDEVAAIDARRIPRPQ